MSSDGHDDARRSSRSDPATGSPWRGAGTIAPDRQPDDRRDRDHPPATDFPTAGVIKRDAEEAEDRQGGPGSFSPFAEIEDHAAPKSAGPPKR